ncbi:VgrG-related protein [Hyalangium gracile]|uniref:VgrG-related protein n=1 Tax=Hyalangium gracile TaxID=394092 RepID=UPI001CCA1A8F|nr:VgrG-related protein [Hyalangium gracile]
MPLLDPSSIPALQVTINNALLPSEADEDLLEVTVEQTLGKSGRFTLRLLTWDMDRLEHTWVDDDLFAVGNKVEIKMGYSGALTSLLFGEITDLELTASAGQPPSLVVTGLDARHAMARGQKTRTFQDKSHADIAKLIAQENGLKAEVKGVTFKRPMVVQNNQSDLAFLHLLARESGCELSINGKKLHFRHRESSASSTLTLALDSGLLEFTPRISAASLVSSVEVRGMDVTQAKEVVGMAKANSLGKSVGTLSSDKLYGSQVRVITHQAVSQKSEADAFAQAELERLFSSAVTGSGSCFGTPGVQAGEVVRIEGVGKRFSGLYQVTSATHAFSRKGGYRTNFSVQGGTRGTEDPETTEELAASPGSSSRIHGVVTGRVTNTQDPDGLGRVKLALPWLDEKFESGWARVATPMAGGERGFYLPPEVEDEVLVMFEHGDVTAPYVVGSVWNGQNKPPAPNDDGKNNLRVLKSRSGHTFTLDDTQGEEKVILSDKTGKNLILIDSKNNSMSIQVDKDLTIQAQGEISVQSQGNMTLKSQGDLAVDCANLSIKARQSVALESPAGEVSIKGSKVTVNDGALEVV